MSLDKRFQIIFIMHIVRIFMITDSRIMGVMFSGSPLLFPVYVRVLGCLNLVLQVVKDDCKLLVDLYRGIFDVFSGCTVTSSTSTL